MNAESFVSALKSEVHDSAVEGVMSKLRDGPAGRRPPRRLTELSDWFGTLSTEDRERLRQVVLQAVHASTFGLLAVLDGVRVIDDGGETRTELFLVADSGREHVTAPEGPLLHDLYQSEVYEEVFGDTV